MYPGRMQLRFVKRTFPASSCAPQPSSFPFPRCNPLTGEGHSSIYSKYFFGRLYFLITLKSRLCNAKPMLKMMWCVPETQRVPSGLSTRRAAFSHRTLNSWSATKPPRTVPLALVHRRYAAALDRHATTGKPVGGVGEDHVHTRGGHRAHQLHAVGEVHHCSSLSVALQIP